MAQTSINKTRKCDSLLLPNSDVNSQHKPIQKIEQQTVAELRSTELGTISQTSQSSLVKTKL